MLERKKVFVYKLSLLFVNFRQSCWTLSIAQCRNLKIIITTFGTYVNNRSIDFFLTAPTGNFWDSLAESCTQQKSGKSVSTVKTTFFGARSIPTPPAWSSFVDLRRQWCRDRCHCRLSWCSWCRQNSENTLIIIFFVLLGRSTSTGIRKFGFSPHF